MQRVRQVKFEELRRELFADPAFVIEYEKLAPQFMVTSALIKARRKARLSQAEVAERMGTTQSSIARMESGKGSVTIDSIQKYAKATGQKINLEFAAQATESRPASLRNVNT
jgi:ribosome-binding protein aMBF1 (putative translation factor)